MERLGREAAIALAAEFLDLLRFASGIRIVERSCLNVGGVAARSLGAEACRRVRFGTSVF